MKYEYIMYIGQNMKQYDTLKKHVIHNTNKKNMLQMIIIY